MKHTPVFASGAITLAIALLIYLPGCKKEEIVQGPTTPSGTASGDVGGNYPTPSGMKLQGNGVSATAPTNGQTLVWNGTTNLWEPGMIAGANIWTANGNNVSTAITGNIGVGTTTPNDEIHIKKDINSFVGLTL